MSENYQALKASGLVEAGVPRELGGGGAEVAELCDMLRILGHSCSATALAFCHAHPSGRHSGLALASPEGDCGRAIAEARRQGPHHPADQRRIGLDRRLRQGGEGRRRIQDLGPQGVHLGGCRWRCADDRRGPAFRDRARRRHPFPGSDEGSGGEGPGHLEDARHARHALGRRAHRRAFRPRRQRRLFAPRR